MYLKIAIFRCCYIVFIIVVVDVAIAVVVLKSVDLTVAEKTFWRNTLNKTERSVCTENDTELMPKIGHCMIFRLQKLNGWHSVLYTRHTQNFIFQMFCIHHD